MMNVGSDKNNCVDEEFHNKPDEQKKEFNELKKLNESLRRQLLAKQKEFVLIRTEHWNQNEIQEKKIQAMLQELQESMRKLLILKEQDLKLKSELKDPKERIKSSRSVTELENKVRLFHLISTFVCTHPFGVGTDDICSYVCKIDASFVKQDIDSLLQEYPFVFKEFIDNGASLEKKWRFTGFKPPIL